MSLAKIELAATDLDATVVINGEDLSKQLRAVRLDMQVRDVPRVIIEFSRPDVKFSGEGVVEVVTDVGTTIRDWITGLDGQQLADRAAAASDWGTSIGDGLKAALLEMLG